MSTSVTSVFHNTMPNLQDRFFGLRPVLSWDRQSRTTSLVRWGTIFTLWHRNILWNCVYTAMSIWFCNEVDWIKGGCWSLAVVCTLLSARLDRRLFGMFVCLCVLYYACLYPLRLHPSWFLMFYTFFLSFSFFPNATCLPLSSIFWYWPMGGGARRIGRYPAPGQLSLSSQANSAFHPFGVDKWVVGCN